MSIVTKFAEDVFGGIVRANHLQKQAALRHLLDLGRSDIYYDEDEESEVLAFAGMFYHYQGALAGTAFIPDPFQAFIICSCLCWHRVKDGLRRYRYAYVEIPRKNAKTFIAAIIAGYLLSRDGEGCILARHKRRKHRKSGTTFIKWLSVLLNSRTDLQSIGIM